MFLLLWVGTERRVQDAGISEKSVGNVGVGTPVQTIFKVVQDPMWFLDKGWNRNSSTN